MVLRVSQNKVRHLLLDTLLGNQLGVTSLNLKAIHDEMNATNTEPFGRMQGNLAFLKPFQQAWCPERYTVSVHQPTNRNV